RMSEATSGAGLRSLPDIASLIRATGPPRHHAPLTANSHNVNSLPDNSPSPSGDPLMTEIRGAAAAVTGAASGIGRALALELAARGCDLALADRDEAGLQTVAAEIAKTSAQKSSSQKVTVHRIDVGEPE